MRPSLEQRYGLSKELSQTVVHFLLQRLAIVGVDEGMRVKGAYDRTSSPQKFVKGILAPRWNYGISGAAPLDRDK